MGYGTNYTGQEIDQALEMARNLTIINNGWLKLDSTSGNPIDLNSLINPGNYMMFYWINGPDITGSTTLPLNLVIMSIENYIYQFAEVAGRKYMRRKLSTATSYDIWAIDQSMGSINPGPNPPANPVSGLTTWLNTAAPNAISFQAYINGQWVETVPSTGMSRGVYDPQNKSTDVFKFIEDTVTAAMLGTTIEDFNTHITDGDIHVTTLEKQKWNNGATQDTVDQSIQSILPVINQTVTTAIGSDITKVEELLGTIEETENNLNTHMENTVIHPNQTKQLEWDSKADGDHTHYLNDTVEIDEEHVVGEISSDFLPYDVKERTIRVSSDLERLAIQKNPAHNGDRVCVQSENNVTWYQIVDDTKLGRYNQSIEFGNEVTLVNNDRRYHKIVYGNGVFVALQSNTLGDQGTPGSVIARSTNGVTWTEHTVGLDVNAAWYDITYGMMRGFMMVGNTHYAYSVDGISWTVGVIYPLDNTIQWKGVSYNESYFAIGNIGIVSAYIGFFNESNTWTIERQVSPTAVNTSPKILATYDSLVIIHGNDVYCRHGGLYTKLAITGNIVSSAIIAQRALVATDLYVYLISTKIDSVSNITTNNLFVVNNMVFAFSNVSGNELSYRVSVTGMYDNWSSIQTIQNPPGNILSMTSDTSGKIISIMDYASGSGYTSGVFDATTSLNTELIEQAFLKMAAATTNIDWDLITNTPTTVAGYGITDMASDSDIQDLRSYVDTELASLPSDVDFGTAYELTSKYNDLVLKMDDAHNGILNLEDTLNELETIVS